MNNDIIFQYIEDEKQRQQQNLELIASENIVSEAVLKALGSELTNKYAEGYPNKRYYGGCKYVDKIEIEAQERAKKLFNAEYVNVQPHSGTQANMAVYNAILDIGDTVMAMDLSAGGHLSHFSKVSMAGRYYNAVHYGVDKTTNMIDYDVLLKFAKQHRPKLIVCGASAYPRVIDFKKFRQIADEVGAYLMADIAHIAGLVAVGEHPSPFPWCDFVTSTTQKTLRGPRGGIIMCKKEYAKQIDSAVFPRNQGGPLMNNIAAKAICFGEALTDNYKAYIRQVCNNAKTLATTLQSAGIDLLTNGTDNHLILLDLRETGVTGKELEERLEKINITVNKNMIPFDPQKPNITSGIRIGTPAVTSRGMREKEMELIGDIIARMVFNPGLAVPCAVLVHDLTERFPII